MRDVGERIGNEKWKREGWSIWKAGIWEGYVTCTSPSMKCWALAKSIGTTSPCPCAERSCPCSCDVVASPCPCAVVASPCPCDVVARPCPCDARVNPCSCASPRAEGLPVLVVTGRRRYGDYPICECGCR